MEAINEKLKADLNMTLELKFISPGDYDTKMQMAMAGGDEWDLCFTSHWAKSYVNAAGKGAYLELDDLLAENAPDVMNIIPEKFWDGIRVNDNIYALMNYQVMYDQAGYMFLKSAVDEQNIDIYAINDWDSLNEAIGTLAEAYPDKYATRGGGAIAVEQFLQDPPISMVLSLPFLTFDTDTQKISNTLFFEKASESFESFKMWKDKGYVPADAATMKDEMTLLQQGQILSRYGRYKPGADVASTNLYGLEMVNVPLSTPVVNTQAVQSTLTAVNVNSKHPEKAIQLYNYFFSNKEAANLLFFGIEGQDYELVGDRVKVIEGGWNAPAWMLGNQFNAYLLEGDEDGVWEETMKGNEESTLDPLFGFSPDRTPIETELATCEAIWTEYKDILYFGLRDKDEVMPELLEKLEKAGLEKITTELQSQVDAFLASNA